MLAVVVKKNPFFKLGTWLQGDDDGWQRAEIETVGGRLQVLRTVGFIFPKKDIAPFIMRPKKKGLDK